MRNAEIAAALRALGILYDLDGADHYLAPTRFREDPRHPRDEMLAVVADWLRRRFP